MLHYNISNTMYYTILYYNTIYIYNTATTDDEGGR